MTSAIKIESSAAQTQLSTVAKENSLPIRETILPKLGKRADAVVASDLFFRAKDWKELEKIFEKFPPADMERFKRHSQQDRSLKQISRTVFIHDVFLLSTEIASIPLDLAFSILPIFQLSTAFVYGIMAIAGGLALLALIVTSILIYQHSAKEHQKAWQEFTFSKFQFDASLELMPGFKDRKGKSWIAPLIVMKKTGKDFRRSVGKSAVFFIFAITTFIITLSSPISVAASAVALLAVCAVFIALDYRARRTTRWQKCLTNEFRNLTTTNYSMFKLPGVSNITSSALPAAQAVNMSDGKDHSALPQQGSREIVHEMKQADAADHAACPH